MRNAAGSVLAGLILGCSVTGCGGADPVPAIAVNPTPASGDAVELPPTPNSPTPSLPKTSTSDKRIEPVLPPTPPLGVPALPSAGEPTYEGKSLKEWLEVLRTGTDRDARTACEVVGLLGKDAVPALRGFMKDKVASVRDRSASAVGEIGDDAREAIPDLIALLGDSDSRVRESAAKALGAFTTLDKTAVAPLVELFSEDIRTSFAAGYAAGAVAKTGKAGVGRLVTALRDSSSGVRKYAARGLGLIGPDAKEALPQLVRLLKTDRDTDVRREAATALGRIGTDTEESLVTLIDLVKSRNKDLLLSAIMAIGDSHADSVEAVECLVPFLSDPDLDARLFATMSLRMLKARTKLSINLLKLSLRHPNRSIRYQSALALASHGPAAEDATAELVEQLPEQNNSTRVAFAYALGCVAPKRKAEAIKILLEAAGDSDLGVRLDACERCIALNPEEIPESVLSALTHVLKVGSRDHQKRAAVAVGSLGPKAAVVRPALLAASQSLDRELRKAVAEALGKTTAPGGKP